MSNHIYEEDFSNSKIKSRLNDHPKKKYLLAGVNQSVEQLNKEQTDNLSKLLISLKNEYDTLILEVNKKKTNTEKLGKQIIILENMENKFKDKVEDYENKSATLDVIKEQQIVKIQDENYSNTSLKHLIERLTKDVNVIRKDIFDREVYYAKLEKQLDKEKMIESAINEKMNQILSYKEMFERNNKLEKNESDLILKYYNTIIHQKWEFIQGADERKLKQQKISQDAKNDTLDKQEVVKRKLLHMLKFYNKFLRRKVEKQISQNKELEDTFIELRNITGTSNLKIIVDKILNKDKDYNKCVTSVTEKSGLISSLKEDIKKLELEYTKLHSSCKYFFKIVNENSINDNKSVSTNNESVKMTTNIYDEEELSLVKKEEEMSEELNLIEEKYRNVSIVYDNVKKSISKLIAKFNIEGSSSDSLTEKYDKFLKERLEKINTLLKDKSKNDYETFIKENFSEKMPAIKPQKPLGKDADVISGLKKNRRVGMDEYDYEYKEEELNRK